MVYILRHLESMTKYLYVLNVIFCLIWAQKIEISVRCLDTNCFEVFFLQNRACK